MYCGLHYMPGLCGEIDRERIAHDRLADRAVLAEEQWARAEQAARKLRLKLSHWRVLAGVSALVWVLAILTT